MELKRLLFLLSTIQLSLFLYVKVDTVQFSSMKIGTKPEREEAIRRFLEEESGDKGEIL